MIGGQIATPSGPSVGVPMGGKAGCVTCESFYKTGVQDALSIEPRERGGKRAVEIVFGDGRRADLGEVDLSEK